MSSSDTASAPPTQVRRRLGVLAVAFLIIAASAPLTVIAGGATSSFSVTRVLGVPFGYIVLATALAVFAIGYAAMSRSVTSAGGFYTYIAQGIGRPAGIGAAVIALVAYNAMQIGIYGMFGFQVSTFVAAQTGVEVPWWVPVAGCIAIVAWMGVNRVDLSAKVLGVVVALEFLAVLVFDAAAFSAPAEGHAIAPLTPDALFVSGVGAVLVFGIAAFMGFESAAIYGEEAKDPRRTIPRATFLALGVIGVFYAMSSWALALAVGPGRITDPEGIGPDEAGPPLFFNFVETHLGGMWGDLISVLFITSLFAALVSFHNAVARYTFSLGRERVLPRALSSVRSGSGVPWAGSAAQTVLAVAVVGAFVVGEASWDPNAGPYPVLTLFTWLTNTGAFGLVVLMALASAAVIGYFARDARGVGVGARLVAPAAACVALSTIALLILANFDVLLDQTGPTATTYLFPALVIVPSIAAGLWALRLRRTRPEVYQGVGHGGADSRAPHLGAAAPDAS